MGRPPKPPEDLLSERVVVHLRSSEYEALEAEAERLGVRPGELARQMVARALRRRR